MYVYDKARRLHDMAAGDVLEHVGHEIEVVTYGHPPVNVAIECVTCYVVLTDTDLEWGEEE